MTPATHSAAIQAAQPLPLELESGLANKAAEIVAVFDIQDADISKAINLVYAALVEMRNAAQALTLDNLLGALNDPKQTV